MTRLLVVMGSGETSPTMVKTHREVFDRLDRDGVSGPAVLLDTPFGFQENADDIAARAIDYFRRSVGQTVEVASLRRGDVDAISRTAALARLSQARWVFAGPGSPTYTMRQWAGTEIPALLADKLERGGAVTFASAAALTLGVVTVPVYEIYKVGGEVAWAEGMDLLGPLGLRVALIPHYDNAEGGNHDTRFCYLGERRLRLLEGQLPDGAFVLGVDEHTGGVFDLDAATMTVVGLGQITVRRHGVSSVLPSGTTVSIADLAALGAGLAGATPGPAAGGGGGARAAPAGVVPAAGGAVRGAGAAGGGGEGAAALGGVERVGDQVGGPSPLVVTIRQHESAFDTAVTSGDVDAAVRAILDLDEALAAWSADTLQSDEQDRGRGALRRMVVRLGDLARVGARDPRLVIGPYVDRLLALREAARKDRRFAEADGIRDELVALGVAVRDTGSGTEWDPPSNTG